MFYSRTLNISEIANKSSLHLPPLSLSASSAVSAERRRPPPRKGREATSCWPPPHAAPPQPPSPTPPRAGSILPTPRCPVELRGRHLTVAVASSLQCPGPPSLACLSTQSTPASYSAHSFASSLPQTSRTPPPPTRARPHRRPATLALLRPHRPYL